MHRFCGLAALVAFSLACATTGVGPQDAVRREDRFFLAPPAEGFPQSLGPTTVRRLDEAFTALVDLRDHEAASTLASELLARNPELYPASVLAAQAHFVVGEHDAVLRRLEPFVREFPEYTAAQLVYGRSSEKVGNLVEALEAYQGIVGLNEVARTRFRELQPRAAEIVALRVEDALARGLMAEAQRELERLENWAPDEERTLMLAADVAMAVGDQEGALAALRGLAEGAPERRDLLVRRAELELEIGDPAAGMRIFESLAAQDPEDVDLQEKLAEARFIWRLQLLPREIRELGSKSEITRGEFATLLFWLFPEVRYGRADDARIANDVLEHPHREQIVRVVNSGLMDVDPSLHRFEPYRPATRHEVLSSMLRMLSRRSPPFACLGPTAAPARSSREVCRVATACGLLEDEAECLPGATATGRQTLELSRAVQEILGVE